MKTLFIEAQRKSFDTNIDSINFNALPSKVFLAYSIQYKKLAEIIKKKLGKKISSFKQVLGCSKLNSKVPILLVGSGQFHALNLALQGNIVYILEGNIIKKLDEKEVDKFRKRKKTAMINFLSADSIGILVSTKPGQENMKKALELKKRLVKQGKKPSIFISDTIDINELENFPMDSWVNTACPAISLDSTILNISETD
tara:strand:+ start:192 stop:788 length:597 start_codon:yes stop_codon:yes gene_type:complete